MAAPLLPRFGSVERVLIVVERNATALLEHVRESFAPVALDIRVIEDRRLRERRTRDVPPARERRHAQRRRHDIGPALRRWGWAVVRVGPEEPARPGERRCAVCGEPIVSGQGRRRDARGDFHAECWERRFGPSPSAG